MSEELLAQTVLEEIGARIAAESQGGALLANATSAAGKAKAEVTSLASELALLKASAGAVKGEIAAWKAWWEALPAGRAGFELGKRQIEIERLAGRLVDTEAQIAALTARYAVMAGIAIALEARAEVIAAHGEAAERLIQGQMSATAARPAVEAEAAAMQKKRAKKTARNNGRVRLKSKISRP